MNLDLLIIVPVLISSVVVHEVAHAWQARGEGDDTADKLGRITLNPLPHLDLWGSIIVPLVLASQGGVLFGWAKPVPVVPANFRNHPWSDIRVSLAGIVSNLGLAVLSTLLGALIAVSYGVLGDGVGGVLLAAARYGIFINLLLAFFNLIPIPPLDGSHVVAKLLPPELSARYQNLGRFGIPILFLLVFLAPQVLEFVLAPVFWLSGMADQFMRMWF